MFVFCFLSVVAGPHMCQAGALPRAVPLTGSLFLGVGRSGAGAAPREGRRSFPGKSRVCPPQRIQSPSLRRGARRVSRPTPLFPSQQLSCCRYGGATLGPQHRASTESRNIFRLMETVSRFLGSSDTMPSPRRVTIPTLVPTTLAEAFRSKKQSY